MNDLADSVSRTGMVVVVGVDLSDVSEHLLATTRDLLRPVEDAQLHVVHAVQTESLSQRLVERAHSLGLGTRAHTEYATWELRRLCQGIVEGSSARIFVHTPVGHPVNELPRIALEVGADIIVLEAHEQGVGTRRVFHRSVVAAIAQAAPCSVLTVRARRPRSASTVLRTAGGATAAFLDSAPPSGVR